MTPRLLDIIKTITDENLSSESSTIIISKEHCRKLLNLDPKIIKLPEMHDNEIRKSKETVTAINKLYIVENASIVQKTNPTNSCKLPPIISQR